MRKEPEMPLFASVVGLELRVPGKKPEKFTSPAEVRAALKKVKLDRPDHAASEPAVINKPPADNPAGMRRHDKEKTR
jgi:hypothetical protein